MFARRKLRLALAGSHTRFRVAHAEKHGHRDRDEHVGRERGHYTSPLRTKPGISRLSFNRSGGQLSAAVFVGSRPSPVGPESVWRA